MTAWDIFTGDLGFGPHLLVVISHQARAERRDFVEVLQCSSQRANRPAHSYEVILDAADGLDWPTFCNCDLIWAIPRSDLQERRGSVGPERRRAIVATIIRTHGWVGI